MAESIAKYLIIEIGLYLSSRHSATPFLSWDPFNGNLFCILEATLSQLLSLNYRTL